MHERAPTVERPTRVIQLPAGAVEYRLEERGSQVVLMLHGGHVRAALSLGEEVFAEAGYTILAPSRPGYGLTPLASGTSPEGFADAVAELCDRLGIDSLAAVVGQSAGGPTAVTLAARHPDLVKRLILQSAVGLLPWPDRRTRLGAGLVFSPRNERVTWALVHTLVRRVPNAGLRLLLRDLTTRPIGDLLATLSEQHRAMLLELFGQMRSGSGFANDVRTMATPLSDGPSAVGSGSKTARRLPQVRQPTLVIASRDDGAVSFDHAQSLVEAIPHARLISSNAPSHFIWLGEDYPAIADTIANFLHSPQEQVGQ
ncbi:alpha/beta hydrolase [Microtetraspora sp. NBRC 16547]|uniref:alpha/beta fold hydrolase n=1 Tax=Microtetraspora sp. NBRC 16547 TaxID=3030993 RepID=UPI0024A492AD|nr:alpha/beta hydrolase [Microtetraspora sp. NBRC 16547]GLX02712.1 putative hydrolase YcgS [Microtetraspora sp. NBRC 16547]